ncbi:MAG: sirohydrochlorin cobaltochelatase [Deltaproteobacteria bacterium]|nr:sirohydrochlorin cobaltochelatase [Deltaproteobacteria bacterium]MBW2530052.1 sirohydrochlorin cobaltochelatase [Deltaproteobacteria bacterium]
MRALLLVDHGSRRQAANAQLEKIAALVRERWEQGPVLIAHMELAQPSIDEAFAQCQQRGVRTVVVVPYFLTPGRHAQNDIPALVAAAADKHQVDHLVADVLGVDPLLAELVHLRATQALPPERDP